MVFDKIIKKIDEHGQLTILMLAKCLKRMVTKYSNNDKTWSTHDESGVGLAELVSRSADIGAKIFILIKFR